MLRDEYGLAPAGVLGHSAGEIAAGYADGCLTAAQTVLIAYHRGRMAPDHGVAGGLMAAVGLADAGADARLAKEGLGGVVVGCDKSPANVTLSGARASGVHQAVLVCVCMHTLACNKRLQHMCRLVYLSV